MIRPHRIPDEALWMYRIVCLAGGITLPATALIFGDPAGEAVDPMWLRLLLAALPLSLLGASFFSEQVRSELPGLTTVVVYVLVAWFTAIALLNGLTAEQALSGIVLMILVAMVAGAVHKRLRQVGFALATTVAVLTGVTFLVSDPGVERAVFATAVVASGLALFLTTWVQHRLRRQLRASEERYRGVFEHVTDGIVVAEPETLRLMGCNRAFREMTGFTAQEVVSRTLIDFLGIRADELEGLVRRARQDGLADLGECTHSHRFASPFAVHVTIAYSPDDFGGALCVTLRDLTEKKRAHAQVEVARHQAEAMLELRTAFLNNMSHEIRTPLVSLTGFLSVMKEEGDSMPAADRRAALDALQRSAERLNTTLNALLDLAQIEAGHYELAPEPIDMGEVARRVMENLRPRAAEKKLALHLHRDETARVLADHRSIERVITNVLDNAIKFTESGAVTAAVETDSHRVRLLVRDTGAGIDPTFIPNLFGAFRQGSSGLGRQHEGSGLGLTLAHRLVDLMGGRIRIESEPGEGTCVTLTFARTWASPEQAFAHRDGPGALAGGDGAPERPRAEASIEPLAARARVLVVEDNADTARLFKRVLGETFDVDIVPTAERALEKAQRVFYDVLLIDIHLGPGMDGVELLRRLRALSAYAHVPAAAVTTYAAPGDRERFLGAGFDAYQPKPFTRSALLKTIEHAQAARAMALT